ncbi:MAG TPA: glycosyltransferase family A protein [Candidatus Sulfotelmatobacter sp.]|jgi:glycosyltransferase involved in cell wall biosynthesis|nr:glycosyltransferase family A protein [Candidatus Sulfotelmatobacter sp.]
MATQLTARIIYRIIAAGFVNTPTPRIAIIIPAFNAAAYIAETLDSVLAQTLPPAEIIVVDDGSADNSAEIAATFSPQVKVLRQKNSGTAGARQAGAGVTNSELILSVDADDVLLPSALATLAAALRANPAAVLAVGAAEMWTPGAANPTGPDPDVVWPGEKNFWRDLLLGNRIRTTGCVLMRRSSLVAAGGWDPDRRLLGTEDWELWLRLVEQGPFARVPETVLKYRLHPGSFMVVQRRKVLVSAFATLAKHRARWRHDRDRSEAVANAEWANCVKVAHATLSDARMDLARGKFGAAFGALAETARLGTRPLAERILTIPRRHATRVIRGV